MVDACAKCNKLTDNDRLLEHHLIDGESHCVSARKARGAGKRHPIQEVQQRSAMNLPLKFAISGVMSTVISSRRGSFIGGRSWWETSVNLFRHDRALPSGSDNSYGFRVAEPSSRFFRTNDKAGVCIFVSGALKRSMAETAPSRRLQVGFLFTEPNQHIKRSVRFETDFKYASDINCSATAFFGPIESDRGSRFLF